MVASFNGLDLGFVFWMNTSANPKARQINAYAGANGLEVIDHGSRGGSTIASGALFGILRASLGAAEQQFRQLQINGSPFALVDTLGATWTGVILLQWEPEGRVYPAIGPGGLPLLCRKYRAEFLHVF